MSTVIKKSEMPTRSVMFQIGTMERTVDVYVYGWGVRVNASDKVDSGRHHFDCRCFSKTKRYPTIEENIKRGLRYFKADIEDGTSKNSKSSKMSRIRALDAK